MSSSREFTPIDVPARTADLAMTYLRPEDFHPIDRLTHVARVTTAPDDMSRAINLAEVILHSLQIPAAVP